MEPHIDPYGFGSCIIYWFWYRSRALNFHSQKVILFMKWTSELVTLSGQVGANTSFTFSIRCLGTLEAKNDWVSILSHDHDCIQKPIVKVPLNNKISLVNVHQMMLNDIDMIKWSMGLGPDSTPIDPTGSTGGVNQSLGRVIVKDLSGIGAARANRTVMIWIWNWYGFIFWYHPRSNPSSIQSISHRNRSSCIMLMSDPG